MMKKGFSTLILILVLFPLISCGGRIPSTKTAHSMAEHYFKRYARQYKTSLFGKSPISKIEINHIKEDSYHVADVDAFVNFQSGEVARVLMTVKNTAPLGWKIISWEMSDLR